MTKEPSDSGQPEGHAPLLARSPRALSGPVLTFDLSREADRLRNESPWNQHGRNAVTLVKYSDLRIVFILMKPAARLQEHHADATISMHTLRGYARVHLRDEVINLPAGHLLTLEKDIPHDLEAVEESAVLLTIAWQGR